MSYIKTGWVNDLTELSAENMNHIEEGIEQAYGQILLAVDSVEPEECNTGDRYYNIEDNLIYTAIERNIWGGNGVAPEYGVFYIVLNDQTIYTYNGATLVSVGGGAGGGGETLPIGSEIDFDGNVSDIPDGWEQITNNANIISNSGITSISFTSSNGYGRVWLFSSLCLSIISFDGTNQTPVITDVWGTHQFTASISGNVITLSSLNNWDHYIFMGTNNISKIE